MLFAPSLVLSSGLGLCAYFVFVPVSVELARLDLGRAVARVTLSLFIIDDDCECSSLFVGFQEGSAAALALSSDNWWGTQHWGREAGDKRIWLASSSPRMGSTSGIPYSDLAVLSCISPSPVAPQLFPGAVP